MNLSAERTRSRRAQAVTGPSTPRSGPGESAAGNAWNLPSLAGRVAEVSDSGAAPSLTIAAALILEVQERSEPAAWIGVGDSVFFPPDFAEWGIDLEALPVIRVPDLLAALAREHRAALLCLTRKEEGAPSLGPLVSLRGEGRISRTAFGRFDWEIRITKDRRGTPGWSHTEACRGTDGLC